MKYSLKWDVSSLVGIAFCPSVWMFKYYNNDHEFSIFSKDCIAYKMNFQSLIWENMANYMKEKNTRKHKSYSPPVTNISSLRLAYATAYVVPALKHPAVLPQMGWPVFTSHTTMLLRNNVHNELAWSSQCI